MPDDDAILHRDEIRPSLKGLSVFQYLDGLVGSADRRSVRTACRDGHVLVNGVPVAPTHTLRNGDVVALSIEPETLKRSTAGTVALLHHDAAGGWAVGAKPAGLPFDASRRGGPCALAAIRATLAEHVDGDPRPRSTHRLDKDTSGVVVVALDRATEETLSTAFQDGAARVAYWALVRGEPSDDEGEIDVALGKRRKADTRMVPMPERGTPSVTRWRVLERLRGFTVLELVPLGGRSHQVRAHCASQGMPVVCDELYREDEALLLSRLKLDYRPKRGRTERPILARPALHAARFEWNGAVVEAPLPDDLEVAMAQLRRLRGIG